MKVTLARRIYRATDVQRRLSRSGQQNFLIVQGINSNGLETYSYF
jgi:hypothetical protein